ncbi:MAG: cysteine desulfurase-like protein [Candidatus Nanopelagicales bacterium]|nr:cysteine desulfurase-like protein [Candidatus Nanopelagicales bacterium]
MTFDVARVRSHFPSLESGVAHFDGPGGTQTPLSVGQAICKTMTGPLANQGTLTQAERNAEAAVDNARSAMADLLGSSPEGIFFGRSMTQITFDIARTLAQNWGPGDEIVASRLDHDANVRPWVRYAEQSGATLRWIEFDPATGHLDISDVESVINERTKLVAITAASNLIGTRPDIPAISKAVHAVGGLLYVDGVHNTPHAVVDFAAMGADFYGCSPYKFFGPHIGVMTASPALLETLHPDKLLPSTEKVPERFELGTLPYELLAGITAAVDFIADMVPGTGSRRERIVASQTAADEHEHALNHRLREGLQAMANVTLYSNARQKTPTELFSLAGINSERIYEFLAERKINAPADSFYAIECSRHLGLGDDGAIRAGLAPYNNVDEIDRLLEGLADASKKL